MRYEKGTSWEIITGKIYGPRTTGMEDLFETRKRIPWSCSKREQNYALNDIWKNENTKP